MHQVCLSQTFCRAHRALVGPCLEEMSPVCLEAMYLVCPVVTVLQAVWGVALGLAVLLPV
jgi:hypothetical protein